MAEAAGDSLYRIRSEDLGIREFQLTVTETARTSRVSILSVSGYEQRSAAASRWLMCVFTHLAIRRGFRYWVLAPPDSGRGELLVGFPETSYEDPSVLLGPRFARGRILGPMSVDVFRRGLCRGFSGWPAG